MVKTFSRLKKRWLICICIIIMLLYAWNYGYSCLTCYYIRTNPDMAIALISSGIGNIDSLTVPPIIGKLFIRMDMVDVTHSPLELACMDGNVAVVEACLNRGADPNYAPEPFSLPLESAVLRNNQTEFEIIKILVDNGIDVDNRSHYAVRTALFKLALKLSYSEDPRIEDSICLLIENGASTIADDGCSILYPVIRSDRGELLKRLLYDFHVELIPAPDGQTPYEYAENICATACMDILTEYEEQKIH